MFLFFPYRVDVPHKYRPVMNWLIVATVILVFFCQVAELVKYSSLPGGAEQYAANSITIQYSLNGWGIKGLLGSIWLHGGILHIAGNLLYLWIFGNAVCSKLGNLKYLPIYVGLGVAAGIGHPGSTNGRSGSKRKLCRKNLRPSLKRHRLSRKIRRQGLFASSAVAAGQSRSPVNMPEESCYVQSAAAGYRFHESEPVA